MHVLSHQAHYILKDCTGSYHLDKQSSNTEIMLSSKCHTFRASATIISTDGDTVLCILCNSFFTNSDCSRHFSVSTTVDVQLSPLRRLIQKITAGDYIALMFYQIPIASTMQLQAHNCQTGTSYNNRLAFDHNHVRGLWLRHKRLQE